MIIKSPEKKKKNNFTNIQEKIQISFEKFPSAVKKAAVFALVIMLCLMTVMPDGKVVRADDEQGSEIQSAEVQVTNVNTEPSENFSQNNTAVAPVPQDEVSTPEDDSSISEVLEETTEMVQASESEIIAEEAGSESESTLHEEENVQTENPDSMTPELPDDSSSEENLENEGIAIEPIIETPWGILTPAGLKDIKDLEVGDSVIGYDSVSEVPVTNTIEKIELATPSKYNYWELDEDGRPSTYIEVPFLFYTFNGQYELFQDQSVFVGDPEPGRGARLVHASEVQVGDTIYSTNNSPITVTSITTDTAHTQWVRLSVSGNHSYIADGIQLHNASRYWVGGGSSTFWVATGNTNWGSASNTQDNASVPGASDDVFFDGVGTGASSSTISASISINSLDMTGYANTLTQGAAVTLTIIGNTFKLSSGMTYTLNSATASALSFTSTTGTSGSPTSITTAGKTTGNITVNGSGGYFTSQDTLNSTGAFTLSNGTYAASASTTISSTFTLSNGTFTAPSGALTANSTFTISGGTFTHNSGTVRFGGTVDTILSCNNTTFNLIAIVHTNGTKTVNNDCTFPLGSNPTAGSGASAAVKVFGTLSGTGTLTTNNTFTASSTNPLVGFDVLSAASFTQTAGTFTAPASTTVTTTFTLSGGTFVAPSGTLTTNTTFTISAGTFTANGGTVKFGGSVATLSCNNATFNLVTFTNTSTKTINSDCSFPLGNNPSVASNVTLLGTLTGTGTLTTTGTFTASSTAPLSGFSALSASALTQTAGTFTAPASTTIASTFTLSNGTFVAPSGILTLNAALTISGGTFDANGGTLTVSGSSGTLSCNNATFNSVVFANTNTKIVSSNCSFPLGANPTIPSSVTLQGTLTGTGTLTTFGAFTASSTNPLVGFDTLSTLMFIQTAGTFTAPASTTISGVFTLSGGAFTAPSGVLSINSTFTISGGTFAHNSGTLRLIGGAATLSCNNATFNSVLFNNSGVKTINSDCTFPIGANPTIPNGITLLGTLTGSGKMTFTTGTFTASSTNPFTGFSELDANLLTVTAGTFTSPASTTARSTFTLSGGTFTAPSGTFNSSGAFTILAGTFDHNNGTLTFSASTATLSCNNATFSRVVFANTSTKTVSSNCSFPLGASPIIPNSVTVQGTLTGTGTLTFSAGTFTASSTAPLSGFSALSASAFIQTAGTFTAPASTTVSSSFTQSGGNFTGQTTMAVIGVFTQSNGIFTAPSGTLTLNNTVTISGGTFNHNNGTIVIGSAANSTIACNNSLFNLVVFNTLTNVQSDSRGSKTVGADCTLPLGSNPVIPSPLTVNGVVSGSGTFTLAYGKLTLNGTQSLSGFSTLIVQNLAQTGGTWTAPAVVNISGNFVSSAGVTDLTGTSVTFDGAGGGLFVPSSTVNSLTINKTNAGEVTLGGDTLVTGNVSITSGKLISQGYNFSVGGTFTNNGILVAKGNEAVWSVTNDTNSGSIIYSGTSTIASLNTGNEYNNLGFSGGLVGIWSLAEGSGASIEDGSGFNNDGTLVNTSWTTGHASGNALSFNGTSSYVDFGDTLNLSLPVTLSAWVKRNTSGQLFPIITTDQGAFLSLHGISGITFYIGTDDKLSAFYGYDTACTTNGRRFKTGTTSLSPNQWYHVAVTLIDANNMSLYVDGVEDGGTYNGGATTLVNTSSAAHIGHYGGCSGIDSYADGLMEEVRVYDRALDASEVSSLASGNTLSSSYSLSANVEVNADITISPDASLNTSVSNHNISVGGNWQNYGGSFIPQQGTVTLNGADQTVYGSNTFYNLTKSSSTPSTLTLEAGKTQTIANALNLTGASGNLLSLRSSSPGTQWSIDPQGSRTLQYLDVQDSNNISAASIDGITLGLINSGNNTGWGFSVPASASSSGGGGIPATWYNPPVAPVGGFSFTINNKTAITPSNMVSLQLNGGSDTARMAISNFPDLRDAGQEPYLPTKQWNLCKSLVSCDSGQYKVYVKFYTAWGSSSGVVESTITFTKNGVVSPTPSSPVPSVPSTQIPGKLFLLSKTYRLGMTSVDIKRIQQILNQDPDTRLATTGPGSPGQETNYFGRLTYQAVLKFQKKYAQEILTPIGLSKPTGIVARQTLTKMNQIAETGK